jgi:hypothetical protein
VVVIKRSELHLFVAAEPIFLFSWRVLDAFQLVLIAYPLEVAYLSTRMTTGVWWKCWMTYRLDDSNYEFSKTTFINKKDAAIDGV